jgi:SAM-dependent methyltransferase
MPYIYLDDENCYRPSEDLQSLFDELVIRPYEEQFGTDSPFPVETLDKVLDKGLTYFDESTRHHGYLYSPEEKVTLYCCSYMIMHLYSSYHLYSTSLIPRIECKNILFVDFGCGPLTSGIAFWAATRQSNITYIGIDRSKTMLNKAQEINRYGPNSGEPFYASEKFHLIHSYHQLPDLLNSIEIGNPDETLTIFNFCYFLQSEILNIEKLAEVLYVADVGSYTCMVYQDPVKDEFQHKWSNFKLEVITDPSQFDASGFGSQDPTQEMSLTFENLRVLPRSWSAYTVTVSYDSFNNFSYRRTIHSSDR